MCMGGLVSKSCLTLVTPWTVACQAPLSMEMILQARILEWVAISFSRGFSWPGDQTHVFSIASRFFTEWATREALICVHLPLNQPRWHIEKQRHYFANKGLSSQGGGFSSGHVWMWELDCEESCAPKNWCFWTVVLKTLESPLDCKEIQPVHSKGDQPWDFFGRTDAEAETPVLWPPHAKSWLIGKESDAWRDWGQEEKGMTEDEMAGWHHQLDGREFEWTPGVGDGQGGLAYCDSWGRKESDTTERLNWTELTPESLSCMHKICTSYYVNYTSVK